MTLAIPSPDRCRPCDEELKVHFVPGTRWDEDSEAIAHVACKCGVSCGHAATSGQAIAGHHEATDQWAAEDAEEVA